jgi:MOSC domain-containing protein YiiM
MATIVSIQIGTAQRYQYESPADGRSRSWTSAFVKSPVAGPVQVTNLGIVGDEQADRQHHGGLDKAVLAYSTDHYPFWRETLGQDELPFGAFGENVSIAGSEESTVCIGDRWQAGGVVFQVSQPRQPCWKMGRRWARPDLPKLVVQTGRSGWYLRVLAAGELSPGSSIELVSRPRPTWTVARASRTLYDERSDYAQLQELADLPELSHAWREEILQRMARQIR